MDQPTLDKINAAIAESLPAQVGAALQQRLKEADVAEATLARMSSEAVRDTGTINRLRRECGEAECLRAEAETKLAALRGREVAIADAEQRLAAAAAQVRQADAVTNAVKETVAMFTKVPEIRRTLTSFESTPMTTAYDPATGRQMSVPGATTRNYTTVEQAT